PKAIRRHVVPAADWARKLLETVGPQLDAPTHPGGETPRLTELLAAEIRRRTSVAVSADDFQTERLPAHLTPTFRVIDERGRTVGTGKNLPELRSTHQERATRGVARVAQASLPQHDFERKGVTRWDFGDVPRHVDTKYAD